MKVTLQPVVRWPKIPIWAIGFLALWALVAAGSRIVGHYTGAEPDLCLFHRMTGHPCPTCGTTRGLLAMAQGSWRASFAWNPLTMTGMLIGSMAMAGRVITAKTLAFQFTRQEKRFLMAMGLVILGFNWAWLLYSQP